MISSMRYPPPGRLVDIGTHRLHLYCAGTGQPAVVFDAALGASSISWSLVQPAVAQTTRACTYDRAGFGWSDAGPMPRTAGRIADELYELLQVAGVPPPYVVVGHSYGGLVARLFAARHQSETKGLVLIEPAIPEEWVNPHEKHQALIARGVQLCGYGSWAARSGLARLVSLLVGLGNLGAARALTGALGRGALTRDDEMLLAPVWRLPPESRRPLRQMWTEPKFFDALGSQIATISDSAKEWVRDGTPDYGDLPLAVVTADGADDYRRRLDAELSRLSSRGRHVIAPQSRHWVPLDSPQAVIDAISSVVAEVRRDLR